MEANTRDARTPLKARSMSIGGTAGSSSMEAIAGSGHQPSTRRRRPAARSQSARVPQGRPARRPKPQQPVAPTRYSSEPRLSEAETPPPVRRQASARRRPVAGGPQASPQHYQHRRSMAFLEVPAGYGGARQGSPDPEGDEDSYRLRTFNVNHKGGIVNRGDSFRRRRSRSNSLAPTSPGASPGLEYQAVQEQGQNVDENSEARRGRGPAYRVAVMGAPGVGKTALISQFQTSECINAYDRQGDITDDQRISIMLNGEESELCFINITNSKDEIDRDNPPDAFVVIYSCVDKASFQKAEQEISRLHDAELLRSRPALLVANKIDMARSRTVSSQDGKCLACTYRAKFIEISVGINHNVDELLVGILNQIRLKLEYIHSLGSREGSPAQWYKSRGVVRASMKARQMITWIFGKEDSKFKNCENLHVL